MKPWISSVPIVCAVVGCDGSTASTTQGIASPASAPTPVSAQPKAAEPAALKAMVGDASLDLKSALAHSSGGRALSVTFSTAKPKCEDFSGRGRMLADGEQHFTVSIAPDLGDETGKSWTITKLYFDSHTRQGRDLGKLTVSSADPVEGVRGELDFELETNTHPDQPARKLVVQGPFTAKGCGAIEQEDGPPARPQKGLSLKFGALELAVSGATVRPTTFPKPGHELQLSTGPSSCEQDADDADLVVELNVDDAGDVTFAYLKGDLLPVQLNASRQPDKPTIHVEGGPLDGAGEVTLKLGGKLDVLGQELTLGGDVTALLCPK